MGFVGSLFGAVGGNKGGAGLNYNAQSANILNPFEQKNTAAAQQQSQNVIGQQKDLYGQLAGQNGIGNQSSVFNQQQGLANMYGMQAMGYGPNPAMAQLAQTTGQNVAQQNALMAGQRGAGANSGLLARQAAMQGSGIQQSAVGQAAIMKAQQQLAAQQGLQQQQGMMGNLATTQVGQQQGALGSLGAMSQAEQQQLLGALGNYNTANVTNQSNINNANAGISQVAAQQQGALAGGIMKGLAGGLSGGAGGMAKGGMVQCFDDGGMAQPSEFRLSDNPPSAPIAEPTIGPAVQAAPSVPGNSADGPQSNAGRFLLQGSFNQPLASTQAPIAPPPAASNSAFQTPQQAPVAAPNPGAAPSVGGVDTSALSAAGNAIGSGMTAGIGNAPKMAQQAMSSMGGSGGGSGGGGGGGMMSMLPMLAMAASRGALVPGKAPMKGDSLKNDKVPALLSPKEIVIPRSITLSKDAPQKAADFVAAVLAKNGMRKKAK